MQLIPKEASVNVECVSNCKSGQDEGLVVNLHPHFTIPADQLHQDQAFPWLKHTLKLVEEQTKIPSDFLKFNNLEEMREFALDIQSISDGWRKIKKAWSLTQNRRSDLAWPYLESYQDHGFDGPHELNHILFDFCGKLLMPRKASILSEANTFVVEVLNNFHSEYVRFREYYLAELHDEHMQRYFDIFSEYFRDFSEFNQTLLFSQYTWPLPKEAQASSSSFKRTRMFYGNAFEVLTSNFTLFCMPQQCWEKTPI